MGSKKQKIQMKNTDSQGETWQTINKGKPIFYKDVKHWIVYEFDDNIIISKNKDFSKAYCVKKIYVSVKPKK
jgi:hypothetical protein